jgi:hypothetical protein
MFAVGALLAASAGVAVAGAAPAAADPGFCGVRFDFQQAGRQVIYTVHNKCDRAWSFRVWLPGVNRYAYAGTSEGACLSIPPGGYAHYTDTWPDRNWLVRNC